MLDRAIGMAIAFQHSPAMTLGVEVELMLVDRTSKDLSPSSPKVFERLGDRYPRIKPEIFQAMVEINTGICRDVHEVRRDLAADLAVLRDAASGLGLLLCGGGSHPFASYRSRVLYPAERYQGLVDRNRWLARRLMICGLHVHIGMQDGPHAAAMINGVMPWLPHLLALSASSPFWDGDVTGLASSRITIFESLPTAGHAPGYADWPAFERLYDALVRSRGIASIKDLWWDIRPQPGYGTIEIRICDALPTLSETVSVVALVQCLMAWLDEEWRGGRHFAPTPEWIGRENKWRASRWGLEADLVVDADGNTVSMRQSVAELLAQMRPYADRLGCRTELEGIAHLLASGAGYERQVRVFERTRSLLAVTESVIDELARDAPAKPPS